jgi:hypothetical protein
VITAGFQITEANRDAMDRGIPIIILENPVWYEGNRMEYYTWAYNGLHGLGTLPTPPERSRPHPKLKPWKDWQSGRITVFGQVPTDKAVRGNDMQLWKQTVQAALPNSEFREHPIMIPSKYHNQMEPLSRCFEETSLAVTYTSTIGAEAVINGIPTIACHAGSLAYPMATHNLSDEPITPCREEWIHNLSWRQWSIHEELDTEYILRGYDEAYADAQAGRYDNMSNGRPQ